MNERQKQILLLLYRFRFLTREQMQRLLNQKDFKRVTINLNKLSEINYLRRDYNPKTVTIPAIYSLGLESRKYLKKNNFKEVNKTLLDRVWRENKISVQFKQNCLLIADIYLYLLGIVQKNKTVLNFKTKTELKNIKDLINPAPDIYFSLTKENGSKSRYFLDIFNDWPPRMYLRKRVNQYLEYYQSNIWQEKQTDPFPSILLVCPDDKSKKYLKDYIKKTLEGETGPQFYLSTKKVVKEKGLNSQGLEKAET